MSTIEDTFHSKYDGKITIKWGPKKSFKKITERDHHEDIDLSSPQIITVERHEDTSWPSHIHVKAQEGKLNVSTNTIPKPNCTIPDPAKSSGKDIWEVKPDTGVTFCQFQISGEQQGNDWGDPNATVTVGDPPPPPPQPPL